MCEWWRHQMETFSALLAFCAGNSPVPTQRPVTRSFDVFFDLRPNKRLSKQSRGWWFETLSCSLWRHCNERCRKISGETPKFRFSIRGKVAFCCLYRFHMLCIDGLAAQWGIHDDVIKWKPFPHFWRFVSGIHRSLLDSPHKGRWRWALMFSLISAWTDGWTNNRDAGDYKATVMSIDNSFELL